MKKRNIIIAAAILFIIAMHFVIPIRGFAYDSVKRTTELECKADGAMIRKFSGNIAVVDLIAPNAKITLTSNIKRDERISLKIKNINTEKYRVRCRGKLRKFDGSKYVYFQVVVPGEREVKIMVSPRLSNPEKFTFAVLGNSRHGAAIHKKILREIEKTDAIFAVNTGDIVNHGTEKEYKRYLQEISVFKLPYFVTAGNYDVMSRNSRDFFEIYVNPLNYSFKMGRFNFIIMDNADGALADWKYDWLEKKLAQEGPGFVFMHIPAYCKLPRFRRQLMKSESEMEQLRRLMAENNVKAVFSGQVHGYTKSSVSGVEYVITGCTGATVPGEVQESGDYHFLLVEVDGEGFKMTLHRVPSL